METLADILKEYFAHDGKSCESEAEAMGVKFSRLTGLVNSLWEITEAFDEDALLDSLDTFAKEENLMYEDHEDDEEDLEPDR